METPERVAVRRALDELKPYLHAFVAQREVAPQPNSRRGATASREDIQGLLRSVLDSWDVNFRQHVPSVARSYVHELIDIRNRWAHEEPFTQREAARARDTARQLAALIGAPRMEDETAKPSGSPKFSNSTNRPARTKSQRDAMREIYNAYGPNVEAVVREYAAAERRGDVNRARNAQRISAEAYARALLNDGERKGWL